MRDWILCGDIKRAYDNIFSWIVQNVYLYTIFELVDQNIDHTRATPKSQYLRTSLDIRKFNMLQRPVFRYDVWCRLVLLSKLNDRLNILESSKRTRKLGFLNFRRDLWSRIQYNDEQSRIIWKIGSNPYSPVLVYPNVMLI